MVAGTICGLIDLSGESYSAYRQMKKRLEQDRDAPLAERHRACAQSGPDVIPRTAVTIQMNDAILALTSLGFRRAEAEAAITQVALTAGMGVKTEQFIKLGLKALAK